MTEPRQRQEEQPKSLWARYTVWLIVPIILALYFSQDKTVLADDKTGRQILPRDVTPSHYDIELTPDFDHFIFNGTVKVDLGVNSKTSYIVLNADEIVIDVAKVNFNNVSYMASDIQYDNKTTQVTLAFNRSFSKNSKIQLELIFKGILNDQMAGFYRSSYKNADGETKYLAATQFEATDARKAFPCWDEPSLKATFDITLNVPKDVIALSNMEPISETPTAWSSNLKTVKFAKTPRMSTYLVAFVVGPFEYIEKYTTGEFNEKPIRTRVYTLPGLVDQGHHALNVATQALEYYAKVFGVPYPLFKLDMVAIPDFSAGAMENWGLVTYRTTALLYDEKNSAFISKRQTAYVVAHELAHQWFGDLVTMEWWDHLWLNEGFATWVGWYAIDYIFPEWRTWTMFGTQNFQEALNLDGLRSSHPIEVPVRNPSEIHQIFDAISYLKGASTIRMITSWLTVPTFLKGIHRYLATHQYGNAATQDLWYALGQDAGKNVSEFMNTWIQKPGYPILDVSLVNENTIKVTQSRYLLTGDLGSEEDDTVWWVPLHIRFGRGEEDYTLVNKTQEFTVPVNATIKLNHGQTGLFRVNYSKELLDRIFADLQSPGFGILNEPVDRAGLVSDFGVLAQSGEQSTLTFLKLLQYLDTEKNYFVLSEISRQLASVMTVFEDVPPVNSKLQLLRQTIFAPTANSLGWRATSDTEPELYNLLRVLAITEAGLSGQDAVVQSAVARYQEYMVQNKTDAIEPDLLSTVYKIVLKHAETEEEESQIWDDIFNRVYRNETVPMDQRIAALTSIGYTIKFDAVIQKNLDLILDMDQVRTQDAWMVFKPLSSNRYARYKLTDYFIEHYDDIYQRFEKSKSALGNAVNAMLPSISNMTEIERLEDFFATKDTSEYSRSLNGALEKAKVNAAQLQREKEELIVWASN